MEDEFKFKSDVRQMEMMKLSSTWSDIKNTVEEWKKGCYQSLGDPKTVNTLEALADMQGRIYICEQVLDLPDMIIDSLKQDELNQKSEEK
jgi:hypothetical protein